MSVGLIWAYGQGVGIAQESAQLIKAIKIQGNKRIEAPAIRGRISLKEGEPFIAEKIREQIRAVYQMGYFEDVRVETEPVAGGVAVIFVVTVDKPKKALVTREYFWLTSWYDDSGIYKKDELANDMERLRQVYLDEGYLTVQVGTPSVELSPDKQWFTIRFPIIEGPQFTYSQIGYQGQTIFSEQELRTGSKLTPGRVVKMAEIRDEVTRVTDLYGTKGYAFADVNPQILPDPASKTAAVTFEIKEEALVRIRNINISGNDKTRDKVIRRELRVNEAELIDTAAMKRSYERLKNLNYFETVEIIPKQVDPDRKSVV